MKNIVSPEEARRTLSYVDKQLKEGYYLCCIGLRAIYTKCISKNLCYNFDTCEFFNGENKC